MALDSVPWFIDGGAVHSGRVARQLCWEATDGETGVGGFADFRVTTTPTPSSSVRINVGSGVMLSRYPGAFHESYEISGRTVTDFPIPATGSAAGATQWLVLRVDDPDFPGQIIPADRAVGPYVRPVLVSTNPGLRGENLDFPNIPLARIVQPINTSTILGNMITDARRIARPKSFRRKLSFFPTGVKSGGHPIPGSYGSWPITSAQRPVLDVPPWATHLEISAQYSGIYFVGSDETVGAIRSGFGVLGSQNGIMVEDRGTGRGHYSMIGKHEITDAQRGTEQLLNLQAAKTAGPGMWYADYQSSIGLEYEFTERTIP